MPGSSRRSTHLTTLLAFAFLTSWSAAQADGAASPADGAAIYAANCAGCHQASGAGIPGVFPPLAGHVGDLYVAENGPRHLANVILFGMQGPITVAGNDYAGVMPGWFQFSDAEVAAVLDHVMTAWGDADGLDAYAPMGEDEVAAARRGGLSPQGVYERRPVLADEDDAAAAVALPLATVSQAQIDRIWGTYERLCLECHGESLDGGLIGGAPLAGRAFVAKWGGQTVASLYAYTVAQMPQGNPRSISARQYADLVALILSFNGHPIGDEDLTSDPELLESVGIRAP
jgi:mono/diheme cytochrome c family protein